VIHQGDEQPALQEPQMTSYEANKKANQKEVELRQLIGIDTPEAASKRHELRQDIEGLWAVWQDAVDKERR